MCFKPILYAECLQNQAGVVVIISTTHLCDRMRLSLSQCQPDLGVFLRVTVVPSGTTNEQEALLFMLLALNMQS